MNNTPIWARPHTIKAMTGCPDNYIRAFAQEHPNDVRKFAGHSNGTLIMRVEAVLAAIENLERKIGIDAGAEKARTTANTDADRPATATNETATEPATDSSVTELAEHHDATPTDTERATDNHDDPDRARKPAPARKRTSSRKRKAKLKKNQRTKND